jgi:hypothetical protein
VVQLNDVGFGLHATIISAITIAQTFVYARSPRQRVNNWAKVFIALTMFGALVLLVDVQFGSAIILDFLYYVSWKTYHSNGLADNCVTLKKMSYVKMAVSTIKYIPQVSLATDHEKDIDFKLLWTRHTLTSNGNPLLDGLLGTFF